MPDNRFFLKENFRLHETLFLEGSEAHHLAKVMRKREGSTVELINGRYQLALCTVEEISKDQVKLQVQEIKNDSPSSKTLILALAFPKFSKLEWVVEKGAELGVTTFWLFPGGRSEKPSLSPTQQTRLEHLLVAAIKQCGRLDLPKVEIKKPLKFWESLPSPAFFGSLQEKASPLPPLKESQVTLLIGPEAGWTPEEEKKLEQLGASPTRLHHNILRAETASLCILAQTAILWQ